MGSQSYKESRRCSERRAFTLIEIVVALTIMAVVAAVAIPTLKGLNREEQTAAPLRALAAMVQEVRQRAMHERRPYQIVFEREAVHACEFAFPHEKREDFLKHLVDLRTPPKDREVEREKAVRTEIEQAQPEAAGRPSVTAGRAELSDPVEAPEIQEFKMPWTQSIPFPPKAECSVLLWGDGEWDVLDGERMRRWVMQPAGLANPARIRLRFGEVELETTFDALTGEVRSERSQPRSTSP